MFVNRHPHGAYLLICSLRLDQHIIVPFAMDRETIWSHDRHFAGRRRLALSARFDVCQSRKLSARETAASILRDDETRRMHSVAIFKAGLLACNLRSQRPLLPSNLPPVRSSMYRSNSAKDMIHAHRRIHHTKTMPFVMDRSFDSELII
jgi:hypothetical protein